MSIIRNKSVWICVGAILLINSAIGIDLYLKSKKPKRSPPPPAVTEQSAPAPEPEAPRAPTHWVVPEIMVSGEIIDGECTDATSIDNYLVIRKLDGTQVVVNDVEWSIWKAVEKGDFIN